jgi:hypothetical protein
MAGVGRELPDIQMELTIQAVVPPDRGRFACYYLPRGSRTMKTVSRSSDRASAAPP